MPKQQEILNWINDNFEGKYTIEFTSNDEIIVNGNISLINHILEELPYKFHKVNGDFSIGGFKFYDTYKANRHAIKSLKNCPDIVTGNFNCALCPNLTSLQYGPIEVGKHYYCHNTGITSFDYIAPAIKGDIIAFCNTDLTNIEALNKTTFHLINIELCNDIIYGAKLFKELQETRKIALSTLYQQVNNRTDMKILIEKYNEANKLS